MNVKFSPVEEGCFRENIHKGANDELKSKATEEETLMHAFYFVLNENKREPRNKLSLYLRKGQSKSRLLKNPELEQMTHSFSH